MAIDYYIALRWPTALVLARTADQYLTERLRREGRISFLAETRAEASEQLGVDVPLDVWKRRAVGKADLFRHDNEEGRSDEVIVFSSDVGQALLIAVSDYAEVAGAPSTRMLEWSSEYVASPEVRELRHRMTDERIASDTRAQTAREISDYVPPARSHYRGPKT